MKLLELYRFVNSVTNTTFLTDLNTKCDKITDPENSFLVLHFPLAF
jgi:hypothetical protein